MDRIELPDAAIDKATEEANDRKRLIEHKGDGEGAGENAGEGIGEMDQDLSYDLEQIQNQDQDREEMEQEQVQDQIRDSLGSEQPGKNPQRSGPEGWNNIRVKVNSRLHLLRVWPECSLQKLSLLQQIRYSCAQKFPEDS